MSQPVHAGSPPLANASPERQITAERPLDWGLRTSGAGPQKPRAPTFLRVSRKEADEETPMHTRGAHEINRRVRDHERRQMLLQATLESELHHQKPRRERHLRAQLARVLRTLALYIEPSGLAAVPGRAQESTAAS